MLSVQDQQAKSTMTKSSLFTVLSNLIDADYQQGSTYSGEPVSITLMDSNDNVNGDIDLAALINPDDELQLVVRFVNTDIDEAHSWVESLLNQIGLENNCEIIDEGDDTDNTITAIFILDDFSDVANTEVQETDAENNINTLDLVTDIDKINEAENILQNIVTTNNINFNSDGVIETNNNNFDDTTDSSDDSNSSDDDNDSSDDDNNSNDNEKINTEEISTKEKISLNNEIDDTNEQPQENINSEQDQFEQNQFEQSQLEQNQLEQDQDQFDQSLYEQNQSSQIDSEEDNLQNEILQSDSSINNLEINNAEKPDNNEDVEEQNSNEEQNNDENENENEDEDEPIEINEELRKAMSSINPNINMYYSMPTNNESANSTSVKKAAANVETKDNTDTNDNNSDINDNDVEVEIIDSDNNIEEEEEENNENIIIASNEKIIIANNNNSVIPTAIPAISSVSTNSAAVASSSTPLASTQVKAKTKTKSIRKSKATNQQQVNLNNVTMTATSATPAVMGMSIKGLSNRVSATTADGRILSAAGQVKEMLDEITANNTMTTASLANLQDVAICKDKMKLSYPLLMKVNPNMAYKDQALFNGKKRYGKRIITYCGEDFYVTNHIFVANVSKIRSYLESLNLIKKSTNSVTVTNPATLKQQAIQNLINQKTGITSATPLATPTDITASTLQQINSSTSISTSNSTDIQSQSQAQIQSQS